jgi:hypothetical protein
VTIVRQQETPVAVRPEGGANRGTLLAQYERYAQFVTGGLDVRATDSCELPLGYGIEPGMIESYTRRYLVHEILRWGGDLSDMFPLTCRELTQAGVLLEHFVEFWFRPPSVPSQPRMDAPYDFFLLKVERFLEFVGESLPAAASVAQREAEELRGAYRSACELESGPVFSASAGTTPLTPNA